MDDHLDLYQRHARQYFAALANQGGPTWRRAGWTSARTQRRRWVTFIDLLDPTGLSVLDVGAGAGGFRSFLRETNREPRRYIAIDLVESNCDALADEPGVDEVICGTLDAIGGLDHVADVITASGLFNFPHPDWPTYVAGQMTRYLRRARVGVLVNAKVPASHWHQAVDMLNRDGIRVSERRTDEHAAFLRIP
jgi:SAM-dependent methyltransferase